MLISNLLRMLLAGVYMGVTHAVDTDAGGTDDAGDSGAEAVGTGNDARLALMARIADASEVEREEELADVNDKGETEPFKANKPTEEEPAPPLEEEAAPPADEPTEPTKHKIKVNGKELELTLDEIIARAQKVEAADDYLRQAAEAKKQATQPPAEPQGPTEEEIRRQQEAEDLALVRAIQMGTEEEAAAALRKLREQASSARPSLNRDDVSRTIDERLAFNTAISEFARDYGDIWSDPVLKDIAFRRDAALLKEGDQRGYGERYKAIGEEIRAWKTGLGVPAKAAEGDVPSKEQRKAAAPKAPAAASAKAKPAPQDDDGEDDDPSSVIANMAKTRGGPQWMRG